MTFLKIGPARTVMQSDGNNFCGDVVLDIFNMVNSNKDSILDKTFENQIIWDLFWKNLNIKSDCVICIFKEIQHIISRNS